MSLFGRANDSIYRTRLDTKRAAYTGLLIDECDGSRFWKTMSGIERFRAHLQQLCQLANTLLSTGRALIDISQSFGHCHCIRLAAPKTALAALGLRQNTIYLHYELIFCHIEPEPETYPFEAHSACPISCTR
jgi:hypothetical protein